ncbi:MAG TPA: DUF1015 domain-containing protein [Actinomycetota bacterium]|nr:DUF1015 domain-containing protein [Actinomycetota bacterium]
MVAVAPFQGLLYDPAAVGDLAAVTSPPYDVILPHEQDRLHRASRYNIALVDLGADADGDPDQKYTRAADLLRRWRRERVLVPTDRPSAYPYEMRYTYRDRERSLRGVILEVGLEPWGGAILPHERTTPGPVEDRLRLIRATAADLSPIYAVAAGPSAPQSELLARCSRPPDRELTDEEGVLHRLWIEDLPDDLVTWYRDQSLLIADGHHRYQTALAHQERCRATRGPGPWDGAMMLVADAATEAPPVLPIHRLLKVDPLPDLPGRRVHDLAEVLLELADDDSLRFGAVFREPGAVVHLVGRLAGEPPTVRALHEEVLDPLPGVRELRFTPDAAGAEAAVRAGQADLALLLPPARVEHVRAVVDRGERLPPKSTYFWPKPRTGLVIRPLE